MDLHRLGAACPGRTGFAMRFARCCLGSARVVLSFALLCGTAAQMVDSTDRVGAPVSAEWRATLADVAALLSSRPMVRRWFYGPAILRPRAQAGRMAASDYRQYLI